MRCGKSGEAILKDEECLCDLATGSPQYLYPALGLPEPVVSDEEDIEKAA